MRIDSAGNVGIGTTNPDIFAQSIQRCFAVSTTDASATININAASGSRLQLGVGGTRTGMLYSDNANYTALSTETALPLVFLTNQTERMRIDSSGNVGIGTTSLTAKLVVNATYASDTTRQFIIQDNTGTSLSFGGTGGGVKWINSENTGGGGAYPLTFQTGGAERMRIHANGSVSIGTTSSVGKVYVANTANENGVRFDTTFNNYTSVNVFSVMFGSNTNTTNCNHFNGYSDGANRILIYGNGNIQNQNNSYAGISDIKLKENVTDTAPKLDKLNQVRVVNYNLKDNPEQKLLGVVAQELELIFPNMVEETTDRDSDGNLLETTTKSVKYSVFVPMLIKAMQEQQAIIENLTTRLNALEGK